MNVFKNTNKTKKFILVIVFLILFSVCCPKPVHAFDFAGNISEFIFWLERGVLKTLNNIFSDENHKYFYDKDGSGDNTTVYLTPETIIKGKFALLDANIFEDIEKVEHNSSNPEEDRYYDVSEGTRISRFLSRWKNNIKKNDCWMVLCLKKFCNCSFAIYISVCRHKNDNDICITG